MFKKFNLKKNSIHIVSLSCNPIPPPRYGGIELIVSNLCVGLGSLGANVVCYSPGEIGIENTRHVKTSESPTPSIKDGGPPNSKEHLRNVASNLAANSIRGDIVLFNHADQYRAIKKMISRFSLAKLNLFEVAHWMDSGLSKNIIYPSFALKKHLRKQGWVIPHGINLKFAVEPCIDKNSNLFFAGRLTKDKGIDIALAACKKIGCKLILAGPDNKSDYSKSILNDPSVIYLGELDYSQIFSQYYHSRGQIYLTQYVEPFGLSVIEAMAAGSPIITTGLGGTGETVLEGRTGFFCSTVDEIARAYEKLDTIAFDDLVSRAKDFTVERMARSYLDLFLST